MGFLVDSNSYLLEHKLLFSIFLYTVLATVLVMFVCTFLHVYRGTQYYLVMFITASVIADAISYMVYSYCILKQDNYNAAPFWYFLAMANFLVYHWALSFTYFTCSQELPYVFRQEKVPKKMRLMNRIFYWTVMVIGCVAASWPFFVKGNQTVYVGMYLLYVFYAFNSAIFMVIALWKIRSFLKEKGMGDKLSPLRMLIHALAFWLYVFFYFGITLIAYLVSYGVKSLFYVHWFVCTIVGFISYIFLFFVLWDLGSID